MFDNEMQESKENFMKMENDPAVVKQFFGFLYTGHIPNNEHAMELFELAAMYDVSDLKLLTEDIIMESIDKTNALDVYTLGHTHSILNFKTKAFEIIKDIFSGRQLEPTLSPKDVKELIDARQAYLAKKRKIVVESEEAEQEFESLWNKKHKLCWAVVPYVQLS